MRFRLVPRGDGSKRTKNCRADSAVWYDLHGPRLSYERERAGAMRAGIKAIAAIRCDRVTDAIPHCSTETEFASMIFQVTAGTKKIVEQRKPGFYAAPRSAAC